MITNDASDKIIILPSGDRAFSVQFGDKITQTINDRVAALARDLTENPIDGVVEFVPSYAALLVIINPERLSMFRATRKIMSRANKVIKAISKTGIKTNDPNQRLIEIPVSYGGEFNSIIKEDLEFVAKNSGLSTDEVISIHTAPIYTVYMIGFMPGFPYLGGLDARLETPRLETPRALIPSGSVGIGGKQTGVYPIDSPGGWRIIGRTNMKLYDPLSENPVLLRAGDRVKFVDMAARSIEVNHA